MAFQLRERSALTGSSACQPSVRLVGHLGDPAALFASRAELFADVSDPLGGYGAWDGAGLPTASGESGEIVGTLPRVGARAAKGLVDAGALLLDVRELDEWHAGHSPDAMLVPMGRCERSRRSCPETVGSLWCAARADVPRP